MSRPPVIGLTGPNSSGKGETAGILVEEFGYAPLSLSDMLREEARARGLDPVRDVLIPLGTELRRERGPGVLAEMALARMRPPALIDSIRNPAEVAVLRRIPGFLLVAVDAPVQVRLERSLQRRRPGDARSLEEFIEKEQRENTADPAAQQLSATAALADFTLRNEGTLEDLRREVLGLGAAWERE